MSAGLIGFYLLKVSVLLLLIYVFNKFLLGRETLHRLNRFLWICGILISFSIPLIPFELTSNSATLAAQGRGLGLSLDEFEQSGIMATEGTIAWIDSLAKVLIWIYLGGITTIIAYHIAAYCSIARLIFSAKQQDADKFGELFQRCEDQIGVNRNIRYIIHSRDISPFSWLSYVVVSQSDVEENGREIITHELAHIKQHHSLDLFLTNLTTIILWFNPAAWLTKQALQQVHEYCADDAVLSAGVNAKEYQLLLIKKAAGPRLYSMANSLNHSNLKNRITMMTKKKSQKSVAAKCLYIVPLSLAIMAFFASPLMAKTSKAIERVRLTEQEQKKDTTVKVIGYGVKDKETGAVGEMLQVRSVDGSALSLSESMEDQKILNVVNGEIWEGDVREIAADDIASISVIKGGHESCSKLPYWNDKYKCEDYDGVIVITLK